jgi:hypothetical protein
VCNYVSQFFIYPTEQVLGVYWVRVLVGYGTDAYQLRHVMYQIISIYLTSWFGLGFGQTHLIASPMKATEFTQTATYIHLR